MSCQQHNLVLSATSQNGSAHARKEPPLTVRLEGCHVIRAIFFSAAFWSIKAPSSVSSEPGAGQRLKLIIETRYVICIEPADNLNQITFRVIRSIIASPLRLIKKIRLCEWNTASTEPRLKGRKILKSKYIFDKTLSKFAVKKMVLREETRISLNYGIVYKALRDELLESFAASHNAQHLRVRHHESLFSSAHELVR